MDRFSNLSDLPGFYNYAPETAETSFLSQFNEKDEITCIVRIMAMIYYREDTGYGVYEAEDEDAHRFNITGTFLSSLVLNGYYKITGIVATYRGDRQIKVSSISSAAPTSEEGVVNVLRTLHGLDSRAWTLYEYFGPGILDLIKTHPEEVAAKIKGVGMKRVKLWQEQLLNNSDKNDILLQLFEFGIPMSKAKQLFDKYGEDTLVHVKENPYFLLNELDKLTFKKCDEIALANDYPLDGPDRILEAMSYILRKEVYGNENCYMESGPFMDALNNLVTVRLTPMECKQLLNGYQGQAGIVSFSKGAYSISVDIDAVRAVDSQALSSGFTVFSVSKEDIDSLLAISMHGPVCAIHTDSETYYMLRWINAAEDDVAKAVSTFTASRYGMERDVEGVLDQYCQETGIHLEKKQREAVITMARERGGLFILNGAAGCGKTFTLRVILEVMKRLNEMEHLGFHAEVMAPTGKAAKVAGASTGLDAKTIHKRLCLMGENSQVDDVMIKYADCVVVDEFSMVDIGLASKLLMAIGSGVKIIILGDTEQLPSVGPGAVLRDLIESGQVPTVTLDVVKRQGSNSGILKNANRVIRGEMIQTEKNDDPNDLNGNAYIVKVDNPVRCREMIVEFVENQIKSGRFTLDDVQVLCPQKSTEVGVKLMNYALQQRLNPKVDGMDVIRAGKMVVTGEDGKEHEVMSEFRPGDKVIHVKNNYNMLWYERDENGQYQVISDKVGIMNGESGIAVDVVNTTVYQDGTNTGAKTIKRLIVQYDGGYVFYDDDFSELQLAYALTIHKSQGSQWKLVITPIMSCNYYMLNRKIFYTQYTRAQMVSVVFGQLRAIRRAIENTETANRKTLLKERLNGSLGTLPKFKVSDD